MAVLLLRNVSISVLLLLLASFGSSSGTSCLSCDGVDNIHECNTTVTCGTSQVCTLNVLLQPDKSIKYYGGCFPSYACTNGKLLLTPPTSTQLCGKCCTGHNCNKDLCTNTNTMQCSTCSGNSCKDGSTAAQLQLCKGQETLCMSKVQIYLDSSLHFTKGCAEPSSCTSPWWDQPDCSGFDPKKIYGTPFDCTYCCSSPNCNKNMYPNMNNLYLPVVTAPPTPACADTIPTCHNFPTSTCHNQQWAEQHCAKTCGICGQPTTTAAPATTLSGCYYKGQVYRDGEAWVDGCDYNCTCTDGPTGHYTCRDLCPTYTALPSNCTLKTQQGECCAKPVCTNSVGQHVCFYKGKNYAQNETWTDGCDYRCTCAEATRGFYECKTLCLQWQLPKTCSMDPPRHGKCCPTPSCPSGYNINYPPGYVQD